jgi:hypothetical protein
LSREISASDACIRSTSATRRARSSWTTSFEQPEHSDRSSAEDLPTDGKEFVAAYTERFGEKPTRYALAAAQAADVMLDAIAASDGSRASVTRSLFKARVSNGILGSFIITPAGDTTLNAVAVNRIVDGNVTTTSTVVVPDALVSR